MGRGNRLISCGEAIGDADVAIAGCVDACHLGAEETAMCGGVAELTDGNGIVNHLMQNRILYHLFRQIELYIDAQHKMLVPIRAKQPLTPLDIGHLPQEAPGMAQLNGKGR